MASRVLATASLFFPAIHQQRPRFPIVSDMPSFSYSNRVKCLAVSESPRSPSGRPVYDGVYGPWTVEPEDVREVILYRSGLVTAAASFVVASSAAFDSPVREMVEHNLDLFYAIGAGGLGLSLYLIHIYVTEIKRTLQAFWALGVVGSLGTYAALARPAGEDLGHYVVHNPSAVWLIGPLFAALTGLVFKEENFPVASCGLGALANIVYGELVTLSFVLQTGLCYGKLEAGILTFIIPTVLLGHLTGLMDDGVKLTLLASWMALFTIFAGRKFTQPIKDDIGDKSVFMFNSLPEDEKRALIEKLERQKSS